MNNLSLTIPVKGIKPHAPKAGAKDSGFSKTIPALAKVTPEFIPFPTLLKKSPRGRKSKLQKHRVKAFAKAIREGLTFRNACIFAGFSLKTYYRWMSQAKTAPEGHPLREFRDTIKRASAIAEDRMVRAIQRAAKKDWRAAAWLLERRWPERWALRPRGNREDVDYAY